MTGPEHYAEAEHLLAKRMSIAVMDTYVAVAQVHATLALAAATAFQAEVAYCGDENTSTRAWAVVLS